MEALRSGAIAVGAAALTLCALYAVYTVVYCARMVRVGRRVRGMPRADTHALFGTYKAFQKHKGELHLMLRELHDELGDTFYMQLLTDPIVATRDLELVELVLVTENFPKSVVYSRYLQMYGPGLVFTNGERWGAHRRLMRGGFTLSHLRTLVPCFLEHAQRLVRRIEALRDAGTSTVAVSEEMTNLALDIIADSSLRLQLHAVERKNETVRRMFAKLTGLLGNDGAVVRMFPGGGHASRALNRKWFRIMDRLTDDAIESGLRDPPAPGQPARDLLDLLLGAQQADPRSMTKSDIKAEVFIFFLAGHETTALTVSWLLQELARHADEQQRLHDEVDRVVGSEPVTGDQLNQLPLVTNALRETLRLYPPVPLVSRRVPHDVEWKGARIPKDSTVFIDMEAVHRDPRYYERPDAFDPDRMSDEAMQRRPALAFQPFSAGPRTCIGLTFFWLEARTIMATLLQRYRVELDANGHVAPATSTTGTLRALGGVRLRFVPRSATATC